jgi:hypothetical protein
MKAVEVAVRDGAGLPAKEVGSIPMRKAFDPNVGPLADMATEPAEREARARLFSGAAAPCCSLLLLPRVCPSSLVYDRICSEVRLEIIARSAKA